MFPNSDRGNNRPFFNKNRRPKFNIPLNEYIRARTLRVIDQHGENLGEMTKEDALKLARESDLDLYVVTEKADVPVARILDYGKYKFEQNKKEKSAKKTHGSEYKEIKMGYNIGVGDYQTRIDHSKKFLDKGIRVKLNITLKGREVQHSALAKKLAERFVDDLMDHGTAEGIPDKMIGRSIIVYIIPGADKQRIKKRTDQQKNAENNSTLQNPSS